MQKLIDQKRYLVEVSPPKQRAAELRQALDLFALKYRRVVDAGHCVSITDNAMGHLSFQGSEMILELGLPAPAEQVLLHLNAFHSVAELERNLTLAARLGIRYVLIISGDGSERLPRLSPNEIGAVGNTVSAVELTEYVHRRWSGTFTTGVAFNQYEPRPYELAKLERKIAAGAAFIVTQPILTDEGFVDELRPRGLPIFIEAWMSRNVTLLSDCIGYDIPGEAFDPLVRLRRLEERHADCGVYLALLSFKNQAELLDAKGEKTGP